MLNTKDNPPITYPQDCSVKDFQGQWYVVHTRSRNEKKLANDLIVRDINYFLPLRWKVHYKNKRKFKSLLPLFTGYLFICGDENDRVETLKTNRVANIITVTDQPKLVSQLAQIQHALDIGADLKPENKIKEGQHCRVTSGPLKNLEGTVISTKSHTRLVLKVEMLGQGASVEVDSDVIEVID